MCIVLKVGIVSNLFSNTINHKLRHCLLTPLFKDFFFPVIQLLKRSKSRESYLYLLIPQLFLEPILTNFQVALYFIKSTALKSLWLEQ